MMGIRCLMEVERNALGLEIGFDLPMALFMSLLIELYNSVQLNVAKSLTIFKVMRTMNFSLNQSESCHAYRSCLLKSWWSLS